LTFDRWARLLIIALFPPAGTPCRTGPVPKGSAFFDLGFVMRVACYLDGFNLYHAIDDLQKPHLKWVDLEALAQSICRGDETLVKVA
jgi:hypothetical protein